MKVRDLVAALRLGTEVNTKKFGWVTVASIYVHVHGTTTTTRVVWNDGKDDHEADVNWFLELDASPL